MKVTDILKTAAAVFFAVILISCGGGGDSGGALVPGISGYVTLGGTSFAGVTVDLSGTATATTTTNSSGYYRFTGLANGSYTITPSRTGCTFTPVNKPVTYAGSDIRQDFTAEISPAISAGGSHSMALKSDGTVWAWGYNINGQLGHGSTTDSHVPVQVSGLTGVIAIAAGGNHSLALKANGTVWAWGYNANGQLGNGTTTGSLVPVQISTLSDITAIAAGGNHSLALTLDGGVKAWGDNTYGQLGDGTVTRRLTPVYVTTLTAGISALAAGDSHSLALTSTGGVKAWGLNASGQLGNTTTADSHIPVNVYNLTSGATAVAAGGFHSLALTTGEGIKAWGLNTNGQLGNGTTTNASACVDVIGLTSDVSAIAAGGYHSLALTKSSGGIKAWGLNTSGQLGNGITTSPATTSVDVSGLTSGMTAIAAGGYHSLGLTSTDSIKAWGLNTNGQLGNSTIISSSSPVDVTAF